MHGGFDLKERKKRKYGEATVALHEKIKEAVDKAFESSDVSCVLVSAIGREVKKDPRTVKFHLKLLEKAEYGKLSKDGKLFCHRESGAKRDK